MSNNGFKKIATFDEELAEDQNKYGIKLDLHFANWKPTIEVWSDGGTLYTWKVTPTLIHVGTSLLTSANTWVQLVCPGGNISVPGIGEAYNIGFNHTFTAAILPYGTDICTINMKFQSIAGRGATATIDNSNHIVTYQIKGNTVIKVGEY